MVNAVNFTVAFLELSRRGMACEICSFKMTANCIENSLVSITDIEYVPKQ